MANLQFIPTTSSYISIDVADVENTHISAPIRHDNSHSRCAVSETAEFLDSIEGRLCIFSYDGSKDKQKLIDEGYVGYLSYGKGVESGSFTVQIHVSKEEFNRITNLLNNGNNLVDIDIDTPSHGKDLRYGTCPDDPIEWTIETNNWVYIENCELAFEFNNNVKDVKTVP